MFTNISKWRLIVGVILLLLLCLGAWHTLKPRTAQAPAQTPQTPQTPQTTQTTEVTKPTQTASYMDATYSIGGSQVTLSNGVAQAPAAAGSASMITTRYFGNEVHPDLNDDGKLDVVFLLTQDSGGSGTFYYAVAALNTDSGYVGGTGFLLGDRIAPQTTELGPNNTVVVNYADRDTSDSFAVAPHIAKTARLSFDPNTMELSEATSAQ